MCASGWRQKILLLTVKTIAVKHFPLCSESLRATLSDCELRLQDTLSVVVMVGTVSKGYIATTAGVVAVWLRLFTEAAFPFEDIPHIHN